MGGVTDPQRPPNPRVTPKSSGGKVKPAVTSGNFFTKNRFTLIASGLALALLLLAGGTVAVGYSAGAQSAAIPEVTETAPPARAVPATVPTPTGIRTCSVAARASDERLASLRGVVINVETGEVLYNRDGDAASSTGTANTALTATAAITQLGADYQLSTRVVDGNLPGSIVLLGGGDPTLSRLPDGESSVYSGAPTLQDLATQTINTYAVAHPDVPISEVVVDASYWDEADGWNSAWDTSLRTEGVVSRTTALQVDGDRDDPTQQISPRSDDPIERAGDAFVDALGLVGVTTREGLAENGAPLLAEVKSAPVSTLVQQMLQTNDATLAESLARVVSVQGTFSGSAVSLQQAIPQALQVHGLVTTGVTIRDGSGLSRDDTVSARFLASLFSTVATEDALSPVLDGLSVAGQSGMLADRFTGDNAVAPDTIVGVSGTHNSVRSLAGISTSADGTRLAFAFLATGSTVSDDAFGALDSLAIGVQACGDNLTGS
jgi:serine-type D-Ala-D-Ala carboxypeptidase/endopeptidase (penicillin-binding protein 4)